MSYLQVHFESIHDIENRNRCVSCNKEFVNLDSHISHAHKDKGPFNCKICQKLFSQKKTLFDHIAGIHEGKMPYKCRTCKTNFKTRALRKRHIIEFHEGKHPNQCKICETNYSSKKALKTHNDKILT